MSWRDAFGLRARLIDTVFPGEADLDRLFAAKRPLRVKYGLDVTSASVTLGNDIGLRVLGRFQELGHTAVVILGDFTTLVGDPSGRDKTRPTLTKADVAENERTWLEQISHAVDVETAEVRHNSEWLDGMDLSDVIKLAGQLTVAQMLERDSFAKRYAEGGPIHLHEFLYCLLQGYDSVAVKADVELGGNDQIFNLNIGRSLQKSAAAPPQVCVTWPLIEGVDGNKKMSKSLGNAIGLDTPPRDMFGLATRVPDELVGKYLRLATELPGERSDELMAGDVWEAKKTMAEALVALHYGETSGRDERVEFERVFKEKQTPTDLRAHRVAAGPQTLLALVRGAFDMSGGDARRRIQQGGVSVDGEKIRDPQQEIVVERESVLKAGKTLYVKLVPQKE